MAGIQTGLQLTVLPAWFSVSTSQVWDLQGHTTLVGLCSPMDGMQAICMPNILSTQLLSRIFPFVAQAVSITWWCLMNAMYLIYYSATSSSKIFP